MKALVKTVIAVGLIIFIGCTSSKNNNVIYEKSHNTTFSTSFNDESYIWESLMFPTNRTER